MKFADDGGGAGEIRVELFRVLSGRSSVWILVLDGSILATKKHDKLQLLLGSDLVEELASEHEPYTIPGFLEFAKDHPVLRQAESWPRPLIDIQD